jgi:hypothetical protein
MEDVGVPSASRQAGKTARGRSDSHSGILHVLKTGCRWRDVSPAYGPPMTIYNRYNRWSQRRIWQRIFEKMAVLENQTAKAAASHAIDFDMPIYNVWKQQEKTPAEGGSAGASGENLTEPRRHNR